MDHKSPISPRLSHLISFGISILLLGAVTSTMHIWRPDGQQIKADKFALIFFLIISLVGVYANRLSLKGITLTPLGFCGGLVIVFISDWLSRSYNLFQGPLIRGELILGFLFCFFFLKYAQEKLFSYWAVISISLLCWCFFSEANGQFIFNDDHSSVFYRLQMLKDNFPLIPFYNPLWNAGIDARDFFATGILNLYLITFPIITLFPLESVYNVLVALVLFGMLPGFIYFAARSLGFNSTTGAIGALLSLTASLIWYRWGLKYGSMGFVVSATLVPYCLALALKIVSKESIITPREAVLFVVTFSLMLLWSLTAIIFIPIIVYALFNFKRLWKKQYTKTILISLVVINLPWIIIFINVSKVFEFTALAPATGEQFVDSRPDQTHSPSQVKATANSLSTKKIKKILRDTAIPTNPLILLFALPGLALFKTGAKKNLLIITCLWLMTLGAVLAPLKPQLELERMLLILTIILCLPAAAAITSLVENSFSVNRLSVRYLSSCLVLSFLIIGTFSSGSVLKNRSLEKFTFKSSVVDDLAKAIRQHGGNGRTLFSAFVLHELNDGHLYPLAYLTNKPIIASSPVHNLWWYTDVIPEQYRSQGVIGIETYLNYLNVSAVAAHEPAWKTYFGSLPDVYKLVWKGGRFRFYERLQFPNTYFYKGSGELISQNSNSITLKVNTKDAVIKFTYYDFLTSSACTLSKESLPGLDFIKLTDCPEGALVTIKSKSIFQRLMGSKKL